MYSIFFNNRRLQFCRPDSQVCLLPSVIVESADTFRSWGDLVIYFECNTHLRHVVIPVEDPRSVFQRVCSHFTIMCAAGGIVTNAAGDLLMIYRYGKWDLPKGKQAPGESLRETALREVAEETGVSGLEILGDHFATTFHCYRFQGKSVLKVTSWFRMTACCGSSLQPQTEEGIEKTEWVSRETLATYLEASYASIGLLIRRKILNDRKDVGESGQVEDILDFGPQAFYC